MSDSLDGPAAAAPPGQQSNLVDPHSQRWLLIFSNVIFLSCTTPMVAIRMYVSFTTRFKWDDLLVVVSWLLLIAYAIVGLEMGRYGAFTDLWDVRLRAYIKWAQLIYVEEILYLISIFVAKMSVLILYKRIFVPKGRRNLVYWAIVSVIIFNTVFYIISTILQALVCIPKSKLWNPSIPGHCMNMYGMITSTASVNVFSDFLMVSIPMAVIRRLQMPRKRKAEVYFIFGFSILCFASSIARLVYSVLAEHNSNHTVALMKIGLWSAAEITSCLVASCVPMVPRLVRRILRKFKSSKEGPQMKRPVSIHEANPPKDASGSLWSKVLTWTFGQSDEEDPYLITGDSSDTEKDTLSTTTSGSELSVPNSMNAGPGGDPPMYER